MQKYILFFLGFFVLSIVIGCGQGTAKPAPVQAFSETESVEKASAILAEYAKGNPMGPETVDLDQILEGVKSGSPEKAELLRKGFIELGAMKNTSPEFKNKAKEMLELVKGN